MLGALDLALTALHTALIAATLLLWIWRRTRRWHLALVTVIAASWLGLGPLLGRGVGYCALTDWHWSLKRSLGQHDMPSSFVGYLFALVGIDATAWANELTGGAFATVSALSLSLEARARLRQRKPRAS